MYEKFIEYVNQTYPKFGEVFRLQAPSPNLFSFQTIPLPEETFKKIESFIKIIASLRNNELYQKEALGNSLKHANSSVLMSFDFHIVGNQPKLIEINTNASHFLTSYLMSKFVYVQKNQNSFVQNSLEKLKQSFLEYNPQFIAILDETPQQQRAYFEFLMYQKWFEDLGVGVAICDVSDLKYDSNANSLLYNNQKIDFVYNRFTDFYFLNEKSDQLKKSYDAKACLFSPHPEDYKLLADKERLLDFTRPGFLNKFLTDEEAKFVSPFFLEMRPAHENDREVLWSDRKKYFFKPKNSHGGKGVYKGETVSRKIFENILNAGNYIAQEFAPAPHISIDTQTGREEAKFDLRIYVYKNEIQHLIGRVYIGQTTNFRTLGGGFAAILKS